MLLIVKAGSTFADTVKELGDFEDWIFAGLQLPAQKVQVINACEQTLPASDGCAGIVVSGSHSMVTDDLPWSLALEKWLAIAVECGIPVLGICYGHQLLARALGGKADYHPSGPEIGCFEITTSAKAEQDRLFSQLPKQFKAHLTHHQAVISLPNDAVILASNQHEPHQAFRVGKNAWGVQFHPEFSKTAMTTYLVKQREAIEQISNDYEMLLNQVEETPMARKLLRLFAEYVVA